MLRTAWQVPGRTGGESGTAAASGRTCCSWSLAASSRRSQVRQVNALLLVLDGAPNLFALRTGRY